MKEIILTQDKFALVDDSDFDFLNQWKWCARYAKNAKTFYALRGQWENGKVNTIFMHRIIMKVTNSRILVDHINHNGLHNYRSNLRVATFSQSSSNRRKFKNSTSKYIGVCFAKSLNKWMAQIQKDGKKINLGYFENEHEAALIYDNKAIELFGEFANINFIL